MRSVKAHYHIHLNLFQEYISEVVRDFLIQRGFSIAPYQIMVGDTWEPFWICTTKRILEDETSELYDDVLASLSSPQLDLQGYLEAERVLHGNVCRVSGDKKVILSDFPLQVRPQFTSAPRGADVHIFRECKPEFDSLDHLFLSMGFYPVRNQKQMIWTLLAQDYKDAHRLYTSLTHYFRNSSQISKVEVEEILPGKLQPIVGLFEFMPTAVKGLMVN